MPGKISSSAGITGSNTTNPGAEENTQESVAWAARDVGKAPTAPPPPHVSARPTHSPDSNNHNEKHLEAIRKGVTLRKTAVNTKPATSAESRVKFKSANAYITDGSWGSYKEKLTKMITDSGGKPTKNQHLNKLMAEHAKAANKTGVINAVVSDRDATGKLQEHKQISKSEYEGYVLGHEQKIDRRNDFKQTISWFLDRYLENLQKPALATGKKRGKNRDKKSLQDLMQEQFGIATMVQTPRTFFMENPELKVQLEKTGCKVEYLSQEDINTGFIDGLIRYDSNPKKISRFLEAIFLRREAELLKNLEALEAARSKHQMNLSKR